MNKLLGLSIGVLAIWKGIPFIRGLMALKNDVAIDAKVDVLDKNFKAIPPKLALSLGITPTIKNPSDGSVQISHPFVEIYYRNPETDPEAIAVSTSEAKSERYTIAPQSNITIDSILFDLNPFGSAKELITSVVASSKIGIYAKVMLNVYPVGSSFPIKVEKVIPKFINL